VENGPKIIQPDGSFADNPYSWNNIGHMLWIDSPVGTGYSYVKNPLGYAFSEKTVAKELYALLVGFFVLHPEYAQVPLYISGESYAGKYIPSFAHYILEANKQATTKINLSGLLIGDGWVEPYVQTGSYAEFLFANKLINRAEYDTANATYQAYKILVDTGLTLIADDVGNLMLETLVQAAGGVDVYDIRYKGADPTDALGALLAKWLNTAAVREQLNAGNQSWTMCSTAPGFALIRDQEISTAVLFPDLLAAYPIINYNGGDDLICNWIGTTQWTSLVPWPGQGAYNAAKMQNFTVAGNSTSVGRWKAGGGLVHLILDNAGHMVPFSQPKNSLAMVQAFLSGMFR